MRSLEEEGTDEPLQMPKGIRKNGKQWHDPKQAFRPTAGIFSFKQRSAERKTTLAFKAKRSQLKGEKDAERQRRVQAIIDKREAKKERARFEEMATKMHRKKVERARRKEKRNKLLKS